MVSLTLFSLDLLPDILTHTSLFPPLLTHPLTLSLTHTCSFPPSLPPSHTFIPSDVAMYNLKESNALVEEWMLLANITGMTQPYSSQPFTLSIYAYYSEYYSLCHFRFLSISSFLSHPVSINLSPSISLNPYLLSFPLIFSLPLFLSFTHTHWLANITDNWYISSSLSLPFTYSSHYLSHSLLPSFLLNTFPSSTSCFSFYDNQSPRKCYVIIPLSLF